MRTINTHRKLWLRLGITFLILMALCFLLFYFINVFGYILISIIIVFLVNPVFLKLKRLGLGRHGAFGIIMFCFFLMIILVFAIGVPTLKEEVAIAKTIWPQIEERISNELLQISINEEGETAYYSPLLGLDIPPDAMTGVQNFFLNLFNTIASKMVGIIIKVIILVPIMTFLLIKEGAYFKKRLLSLIPNQYFEITVAISHEINDSIQNFIYAKGIQMIIVTTITSVGFLLLGMPVPIFLGLFVGLLNIIPYLGPLLGIIPTITMGYLLVDTRTAVLALGVVLIAQLVDNAFTQPILLPKLVNEHPLVVVIVTLFGAELFGAIGLILAIPLFSIFKVIMYHTYKALDVIYSREDLYS